GAAGGWAAAMTFRLRGSQVMRSLGKILLTLVATTLLAAACAPCCVAQVHQQPELVGRLWPLFRSTRPVPLLPQTATSTEDGERKRPLIAPFLQRKIDINSARLMDLQDLPGVGPAMGAHIMAGRPYRDFDDLLRDGVPLNVVQ